MRKSLLFLLASACTLLSFAQIGIGTTSPNSTLDVRGSLSVNYRSFTADATATATDNTLIFNGSTATILTLPDAAGCTGRIYNIKNASNTFPLPVLTINTTSAQTIDTKAFWLLNDSKEMMTVVSDGANWTITSAGPVKDRNNRVIVQTAIDFPAPVAGVINLLPGTIYEVNGTVVLTDKINLNGCYLVGTDAFNDKLIYTTGSGELFTGTKGGTIKHITLVANATGAKLFNLNMGATDNLIVREAIITNCKDVGLVKGGDVIFFAVINYTGNTNGITYENNSHLLLDNITWFSSNGGTFEKLVGTFDIIQKLGGFSQPMLASSGVGFDISGITNITNAGIMVGTAFIGTGTKVNGSFSLKWEVESLGITTEKDDVATGNLYLTTVLPTPIAVMNSYYKVLGTTTAVNLFRVTATGSNRLAYTGTKTKKFQVIASLSTISNGDATLKNFSFYIAKNGVILPESRQTSVLLNNNLNPVSLTLSCMVSLATNDYIELYVANNSDATDIIVRTLNLTIR